MPGVTISRRTPVKSQRPIVLFFHRNRFAPQAVLNETGTANSESSPPASGVATKCALPEALVVSEHGTTTKTAAPIKSGNIVNPETSIKFADAASRTNEYAAIITQSI